MLGYVSHLILQNWCECHPSPRLSFLASVICFRITWAAHSSRATLGFPMRPAAINSTHSHKPWNNSPISTNYRYLCSLHDIKNKKEQYCVIRRFPHAVRYHHMVGYNKLRLLIAMMQLLLLIINQTLNPQQMPHIVVSYVCVWLLYFQKIHVLYLHYTIFVCFVWFSFSPFFSSYRWFINP